MKWVKRIIGVALVLGAAGIAVAGLRDRPAKMVDVQFAQAKRVTITRTITGAGKVEAATTVKISSNISGDLIERPVKEGDRVKKGQILGQIDRQRFEAAVRQQRAVENAARADIGVAQVEVDRTEHELGRVQGLVDKGLASGAEADRAKADRDAAVARLASATERRAQAVGALDEALNNLSKTTLVSPIDGTVIQVSREVGERVRGSDFSEDAVMTVAALSAMEVKIEVGEHEVVFLREGHKAEVTVDALEGQTFEGTVTEIAQNALIKNPGTEAETTSFPVKVTLNVRPPGALPGMSGEVRIAAETHDDALTVPIQAVTVRPEKMLPELKKGAAEAGTQLSAKRRAEGLVKVVFTVDAENRVHARRVRTGIASDTEYEILEGIQDGERIVEGPYRTIAKDLKEGDVVREAELPGPGRG
jgi:HlyD family secretion protein